MVAKPVEKLNRLIGYMIVGFCDCRNFTVRHSDQPVQSKGEKREIGILLSMGEHRKRILGQFVLREFGSGFDCPGFCGAVCDTNSRVFRRSDDFESG